MSKRWFISRLPSSHRPSPARSRPQRPWPGQSGCGRSFPFSTHADQPVDGARSSGRSASARLRSTGSGWFGAAVPAGRVAATGSTWMRSFTGGSPGITTEAMRPRSLCSGTTCERDLPEQKAEEQRRNRPEGRAAAPTTSGDVEVAHLVSGPERLFRRRQSHHACRPSVSHWFGPWTGSSDARRSRPMNHHTQTPPRRDERGHVQQPVEGRDHSCGNAGSTHHSTSTNRMTSTPTATPQQGGCRSPSRRGTGASGTAPRSGAR